jgi:hypothetical protein
MKTQQRSLVAEHLTPLNNTDWAIWRVLEIRGAGFPASLISKLAASECAATVDHLLLAQNEAKKLAIDAIFSALQSLPENQTSDREHLLQLKRALHKNKLPLNFDAEFKNLNNESVKHAIKIYQHEAIAIATEWENFRVVLSAKISEISENIREIAQDQRFREALVWQNRRLLHRGINSLINKDLDSHSRNSKHRSNEQLVAMYLQRYCIKNDQIGFFGPTGWAHLVAQKEPLTIEPGDSLLASRSIGFEAWCIESLAENLSQNKDILPWVAPRCLPYIRVEEETLYVPTQSPTHIPPIHAAILQSCTGENVAKNIADQMLKRFPTKLETSADVYQILEYFQSLELIVWKLEIPIHPNAEQILRRQLQKIEDDNLQKQALEPLEKLENARDHIISAVGNPEKLDIAIAALEKTFTQLTGVGATRSDGETYVGRTLVYEDCVRDIKIELGQTFIEELERPLSLLLDSARWMTFQAATICRQAFQSIYSQLVAQTNSPIIDALAFWHQVKPILLDEEIHPFNDLMSEFQQRWQKILTIPEGRRRITFTSEELYQKVLDAFDAPSPGWLSARYHSFDLMIDTPSIEAMTQGNYLTVLGELHIGFNPLLTSVKNLSYLSPEQILENYQQDIPESLLIAAPPQEWPGLTTLTSFIHILPKDYCLVAFPNAHGFERSQILAIAELVVENTAQGLVIRTRDGKLQFDIIEAFAEALLQRVVNSFKFLNASSNYLPRITIDNLTIQRETWSYIPGELPFVYENTEIERFIKARQWVKNCGLPRYVFVKAAIEAKPFYIDFESPVYIDILAKIVRRSIESNLTESPIRFSEMLPTHKGLWLVDAEGQHYTSELRMVALDLAGSEKTATNSLTIGTDKG